MKGLYDDINSSLKTLSEDDSKSFISSVNVHKDGELFCAIVLYHNIHTGRLMLGNAGLEPKILEEVLEKVLEKMVKVRPNYTLDGDPITYAL